MKMARRRPPEPYIPFISLADIAWQIIIFFLLAATFAKSDSLNLELPGASSDKSRSAAPTITVEAGENALLINGQHVALASLEGRIRELLAGKKPRPSARGRAGQKRPLLPATRRRDVRRAAGGRNPGHVGGIAPCGIPRGRYEAGG